MALAIIPQICLEKNYIKQITKKEVKNWSFDSGLRMISAKERKAWVPGPALSCLLCCTTPINHLKYYVDPKWSFLEWVFLVFFYTGTFLTLVR